MLIFLGWLGRQSRGVLSCLREDRRERDPIEIGLVGRNVCFYGFAFLVGSSISVFFSKEVDKPVKESDAQENSEKGVRRRSDVWILRYRR
jgi:hypothetical protein